MSLLASLLAFSSLNPLTEREDRAASASSRFFGDDDDSPKNSILTPLKNRTTSKSLSKMNFYSNQKTSNIDPKHRSLQRIAHSFNMKVRKQYYEFFISLETLCKNKDSKSSLSQSRKVSITHAIGKLEQTFSVITTKQFENSQKGKVWQLIKRHAQIHKFLSKVDRIFLNKKEKIAQQMLFCYFKDLDFFTMKAQIFLTALQSFIQSKQSSSSQGTQMFRIFIQRLKDLKSSKITHSKEFQESSLKEIKKQIIESPVRPRAQSSQKNSPIRLAKRIPGLQESTHKESLQSYQQQFYKCYKVFTNFSQKLIPHQLCIQSHPKMLMRQIPQQISQTPEIGDLSDKSNIFRQFKNNLTAQSVVCSQIDKLDLISVVGESFSRIGTLISDLQKNKEEEFHSKSDLVYTPYLPCQSSVSTIHQRNDSNFGSEAVSFKNSLVQERQSMKNIASGSANRQNVFKKKNPQPNSTMISLHQLNSSKVSKKPNIKKEILEGKIDTEYLYMSRTSKASKCQHFFSEDDITLNYQKLSTKKTDYEVPLSHYSSEGKSTKSFSFNSQNIASRRLKFNQEFSAVKRMEEEQKYLKEKKEPIRKLDPNAMKGPISWKNQLIDKKLTMLPVRDKSSGETNINPNKIQPARKYIDLSRRER